MSAFKRQVHWLALLLLAALFASALLLPSVESAVQAQTEEVIRIPAQGRQFLMKLSPQRDLAAVFALAALYNNETAPQYLNIPIIDLAAGEEIALLSGFSDFVSDVVFNSDGTQLVSYHQNGEIRVWDVREGELIRQIPAIVGNSRLFLLPDDKTLLSIGNQQGKIFEWDIDTGAITRLLGYEFDTLQAFIDGMDNLGSQELVMIGGALSPDARTLATVSGFENVLLWDLESNQATPIRAKSERPNFGIRKLEFTPDGAQLVFYEPATEQIVFWDIAAGEVSRALDAVTTTFALSADGSMLAWLERGDEETLLHIVPLDQPEDATEAEPISVEGRLLGMPPTMSFSADGQQLIIGGLVSSTEENYIYLYPVAQS